MTCLPRRLFYRQAGWYVGHSDLVQKLSPLNYNSNASSFFGTLSSFNVV